MTQPEVNHPQHHNNSPSGVECIDVVEHMNFNLGNAIKYIWRAGDKGDALTDLRKARWYIDREIARRDKRADDGTTPDLTPAADVEPSETPRCVAHGNPDCDQCHLTRPGGLDEDGNCTCCETYADSGLHWDTCPNRAFEVYYGDDSAALRPELNELRSTVRQVAYELEHVPSKYTLAHAANVDHNCNAARVVDLTYADLAASAGRLRAALERP